MAYKFNPKTKKFDFYKDATSISGTASDTIVTEGTFGQSSTAGVLATYSRGDHTHGTPANPVTAHAAITSSVHNFDSSGNAPAQTHDNARHSVAFGKEDDIRRYMFFLSY